MKQFIEDEFVLTSSNAEDILKEKFGDSVVIKKFEKPKSWLS